MHIRRIVRGIRPSGYDLQAYIRAVQSIGGSNLVAYWPLDEAAGTMAFSVPWALGTERLSNTGFETAGGGGADIWANWTETAGDGAIADEGTLVHTGSHAAKLTAGATSDTYIHQGYAATAGKLYRVALWTRGDGTYAGSYGVWNGSAYDFPETVTGITGTTYTQVVFYFAATSATITLVLNCPSVSGGIAYFDDVSIREVLTGEPLTISGCTLGQAGPPQLGRSHYFDGVNDVDTQWIYDDQTGASWGPANHGLCLANGVAFLRTAGVNLSGFAGVEGSDTPYMVVLTDAASKVAWGYLGAADAAQALGAAKGLTGITKANPGVVTFNAGHGYSNGMLIKFSGLTEMTELNGGYCTLAGQSGDTFQIVNTSTYGAAETTGGNCAQQVTDVGTDGVHLVSTRNGSTRNWAGIEAGFDYNDSAYTFQVRKTLFQITGNISLGCWVRLDDVAKASEAIFAKLKPSGQAMYYLIASNDDIGFGSNNWNLIEAPDILLSARWYLIIATNDGTTSRLYLNGVQVASGAQSNPADTYMALAIGADPVNAGRYLQGNLAHAFIMGGKALNAAEVKRLYDLGKRAHSG